VHVVPLDKSKTQVTKFDVYDDLDEFWLDTDLVPKGQRSRSHGGKIS